MTIEISEGLSFDDVLLVPTTSHLDSRSKVNTSVKMVNSNKEEFIFSHPIIPANMKTITGKDMAIAIASGGGLAILHRFFDSYSDLLNVASSLIPQYPKNIGYSIGVKPEDYQLATQLIDLGAKIICIDIAHGDSKLCRDMIGHIKKHTITNNKSILLIAGNVATGTAAYSLWEMGADVCKVGIGNGCLGADTQILMSDGSYKNIIDIVPGDKVINKFGKPVSVKNMICTGKKKVLKVRHTLSHREMYVTSDHQFWLGDANILQKQSKTISKQDKIKWKAIGEVSKRGDLFDAALLAPKNFELDVSLNQEYQIAKILEISEVEEEQLVYDIEVDCDTHSFIANNVIVHNSLCSTRIETGNGVPQLTALDEVYDSSKQFFHNQKYIIADGGIKNSGDIVKALTRSHMVMVGSLFAGCQETPGNNVTINNKIYKNYEGSSTHKTNYVEGVKALVPSKGPAIEVVNKLLEGIRSGCSYQGTDVLSGLKRAKFVKISSAGMQESKPHNPHTIQE